MQITCPNCATRYQLPDNSVPAAGRKVKCRSCGHIWMQRPPEPEEAFERTAIYTSADDMPTEVRPMRDLPPAPSFHAGDSPPRHRAAAAAPPKKRRSIPGAGWLALAASLSAVIVGGALARQQVVHLWPPANLLYQTVGLGVAPPGVGLQLQNSRSEQRQDGASAILVVEGQIVNVSDQPQKVPRVRAVALDAEQKTLQTWTIEASASSLMPGEIATFFSAQRDPGPAALLKLTFEVDGVVAEKM